MEHIEEQDKTRVPWGASIRSRLLAFPLGCDGILPVAMLVAVLIGVFYTLHLGDTFAYPDEEEYYEIAANLVSAGKFSIDGVHPTAYRPPGYPAFLSIFVYFGAGPIELRMVNFLLLAGCIYVLNRLLKDHAYGGAANLSPLLIFGYPAFFYMAGTLFPQTLGSLLFLMIIRVLTRNTLSLQALIEAGVLFGALILTIPFFIFMIPPLAAYFLWFRDRGTTMAFMLTVLIALAPAFAWSARNHTTFGSFVFISSNSGLNLLLGNSENTEPNLGINTDISKYKDQAYRLGLSDTERDAFYKSQAVAWILDNKLSATKLYIRKLVNYFNYTNQLWVEKESSGYKDALLFVTYYPLLFLVFGVRLAAVRRREPARLEVLLAALYLSGAIFYAIFFTRIRFKLPFDFLLIALAAIFTVDVIMNPPNVLLRVLHFGKRAVSLRAGR